MVPTAGEGVLEELRYLLLEVHQQPADRVEEVVAFVRRASFATDGHVPRRPCDACGLELSYLLITPCCHTLCPECVRPHHKASFPVLSLSIERERERETLAARR